MTRTSASPHRVVVAGVGAATFLLGAALATTAAALPQPLEGTISDADRARAATAARDAAPLEMPTGCIVREPHHDTARGGSTGSDDAAHYARGSVMNVFVFVDHDGGTWDPSEMAEQGAKAELAKEYYTDHAPPEVFLTFDHEGDGGYYFYLVDLDIDIAAAGEFTFDMIEDAVQEIGFNDTDGDGGVIDDMTVFLQRWNGGWDNVILTFIPADFDYSPSQAGWIESWCKVDYNDTWPIMAHEWGHVFGACDEGGGPAGCNGIDCDDICMSWFLVDQVPNGNCTSCGGVDCMMRAASAVPPCSFTERNWAWVDADGSGLPDNTVNWDPVAGALYDIWELHHNGWLIHSNETWGFVANQRWRSWSAMGVRSRGASDWAIRVFGENNANHHLASDFLSPGVKVVVGDFNHNNLGQDHIRLMNTGGAGQYVLSYEAGNGILYPDGVERAYSWDDRNVVRAYDLPLFGGETIQIQLDIDTAGLDLGMALFKSDGGTYYAPRTSALWEENDWPAGISESYTFEVPEDDVYGLVLWSDTEVDGDFSIQVGPSLYALSEGARFTSFGDLQLFSFAPEPGYWAVTAVRPGESSNVKLSLFADSRFETHLQTSGAYPNVEFIAADYNPGATTDYLRVVRQSGATAHTTQWEQEQDLLGGWVDDSWGSGHVARVWDAYLRAGQRYRVQEYDLALDTGIYLISSADGDRYTPRSGADAGSNGSGGFSEWFTYVAPADDWYGVVMIANDGDSEGSFDIGIGPYESLDEESPVHFPDEVVWSDLDTENGSWAVVGVVPEAGSASRLGLWSCDDFDVTCFGENDVSGRPAQWLAIDGNHDPATTYYTRADRVAGVGAQSVSFDVAPGNDVSFDDVEEVETTSGSFVANEVVKVHDLNVAVAPVSMQVVVIPRRPGMDLAVGLHDSGDGDHHQGSDEAVAYADLGGPGQPEELIVDVAAGDIWGLVVANLTGEGGDYDVYIHRAGLLAADDPAGAGLPTELGLLARGALSARPTLELALPERSRVRLDVFDISGRRVRTLADDALDAGVHAFAWDGRTAGGDAVAAGVYFAKLHAMGQERTVKLIRRR